MLSASKHFLGYKVNAFTVLFLALMLHMHPQWFTVSCATSAEKKYLERTYDNSVY